MPDKFIKICILIYVAIYINHIFGILPNNWEDLLFHIDFFLFGSYIANQIKEKMSGKRYIHKNK